MKLLFLAALCPQNYFSFYLTSWIVKLTVSFVFLLHCKLFSSKITIFFGFEASLTEFS